jgi:hypothetical protein
MVGWLIHSVLMLVWLQAPIIEAEAWWIVWLSGWLVDAFNYSFTASCFEWLAGGWMGRWLLDGELVG